MSPGTSEGPSPVDLVRRGLVALAVRDWTAIRAACQEDVVLRIPGRSPIAGTTTGVDALVERFHGLISGLTAGDRPAELVDITASEDRAVVVQRNTVALPGREPVTVDMLVLAEFRGGLLATLQYFSSDQYLLDEFWSQRMG